MSRELDYGIIIPVRMDSTRLPGKPLINLLGKSMIQRTWERCCQAVGVDKVYIATESNVIASHVKNFGGNIVYTSNECLTGTDRVAEANKKLCLDFVINVQGDEPVINPKDILTIIKEYQSNRNNVVNGMAKIVDSEEFFSRNIPKVVFSNSKKLLYMSRSPIPGSKFNKFAFGYKQICIYAFSKEHLDRFTSFNEKTQFEKLEDIEILRFLENDISVKMVEVSGNSLAVDIPEDIKKVESLINKIDCNQIKNKE